MDHSLPSGEGRPGELRESKTGDWATCITTLGINGEERESHSQETKKRTGEMAHWVKGPGDKSDDLSSIPRTHMIEREN